MPVNSASRELQKPSGGDFTEKILYSFPLNPKTKDPIFPSSFLFARSGDLYGATSDTAGFRGGIGAVFELKHKSRLKVAARFRGKAGGTYPSGLVADESGALYGTTREGGDVNCLPTLGCGTVFKLIPSGSSYARSTLYRFKGDGDGIEPGDTLALDADGELYGTTIEGGGGNGCGSFGCGTVFGLRPARTGYRERVLYRFEGGVNGSEPVGGVTLDSNGNLYGVTSEGGNGCSDSANGCGIVYELARGPLQYDEVVLYRFAGTGGYDGAFPTSLIGPDHAGNFYGTTEGGGDRSCARGCGTVFKLERSGSGYSETVLTYFGPAHGQAPREPSRLFLSNDELYGTTQLGGRHVSYFFPHGCGTVFQVNPSTGRLTIVHDFSGPPDGAAPTGGVIVGHAGSLYGATANGGTGECSFFTGCGTIYELSPSQR